MNQINKNINFLINKNNFNFPKLPVINQIYINGINNENKIDFKNFKKNKNQIRRNSKYKLEKGNNSERSKNPKRNLKIISLKNYSINNNISKRHHSLITSSNNQGNLITKIKKVSLPNIFNMKDNDIEKQNINLKLNVKRKGYQFKSSYDAKSLKEIAMKNKIEELSNDPVKIIRNFSKTISNLKKNNIRQNKELEEKIKKKQSEKIPLNERIENIIWILSTMHKAKIPIDYVF